MPYAFEKLYYTDLEHYSVGQRSINTKAQCQAQIINSTKTMPSKD